MLKALGAPPEEVNAILESKRKEVMTGKSLEESEEEMAMAQLGIEPAEAKKAANSTETEEAQEDLLVSAAAERLEETKEKSPFVAQVIGEVCPEVVEDTEEPEITPEETMLEGPSEVTEDGSEGSGTEILIKVPDSSGLVEVAVEPNGDIKIEKTTEVSANSSGDDEE